MKKQIPADLLNKYLRGQCTAEEEAFINVWYDSFENNFDHISSLSDAQKQILKSRIRSRINLNAGRPAQAPAEKTPVNTRGSNIRYIIYAASGIAASLLIVFALLLNRKTIRTGNDSELIIVTNNMHTIYDQVLSDGSHVWLNPGAQIKFTKVFTGNKREIYMTGESFFEVTKNPARPFIIYSGNLVTKVWGTSFRIRDAKYLPYADVTVVTGKVSIKLIHSGTLKTQGAIHYNKDEEVMIYPDQKVTYTKISNVFKENPKTDMKDLQLWKRINLVFDNRQMSDVIPVLNKQFSVNISASDNKIKTYLLNADFNDLNLPQVMELLHKTLNVDYEIKGQDITLKSNQ